MNYNEDPDDDGQKQRDERVERRMLAREEAEKRAAMERPLGWQIADLTMKRLGRLDAWGRKPVSEDLIKFWRNLQDVFDAMAHPRRAWQRFQKRHALGPTRVPMCIGHEIILMQDDKPVATFVLTRVKFNYKRPNEVEFMDKVEFMNRCTVDRSMFPGVQ